MTINSTNPYCKKAANYLANSIYQTSYLFSVCKYPQNYQTKAVELFLVLVFSSYTGTDRKTILRDSKFTIDLDAERPFPYSFLQSQIDAIVKNTLGPNLEEQPLFRLTWAAVLKANLKGENILLCDSVESHHIATEIPDYTKYWHHEKHEDLGETVKKHFAPFEGSMQNIHL